MAEIIKDVKAFDDAGTIEAFARMWCGRVYDHIYPSGSEPLSPQDEGAMRNALPPKCHKLLSPDITAFVNEERMAQDWGEVSVRLVAASLKDINVLATALAEDADRRTAGQEVLQPRLLDLLLPKLELWGLLLAKGIDPTRRQWARDVALEYKNLTGLANTPWPTIEGLIKVDELDERRDSAAGDEDEQKSKEEVPPLAKPAEGPSEASTEKEDEKEPPSAEPTGDASEASAEDKKEEESPSGKPAAGKEQEVPITSTELHTLQTFFANAPNAPPIRKEAMEFGVGLAAAHELEEKGIRTASKLSDDDVDKLALDHTENTRVISNRIKAMRGNTIRRESEEGADDKEEEEAARKAAEEAAQLRNSKLIEEERGRLKQSLQDAEDLLAKVDVNGTLDGGEEKLRSRLEAAKARVAASDGWEGQLSSSESLLATAQAQTSILAGVTSPKNPYATDEQLVASVSGGSALYGVNLFPNKVELSRIPLAPVLKPPEHVDLRGPNMPFEARVMKTTSEEIASSFHNSTRTTGMTAAESSVSSWGASASVSGYGAKVSAGHSESKNSSSEESESEEETKTRNNQSKTSTATIVEYILCPMKSFRIDPNEIRLSDEAINSARKVESLREAMEFLDTFGSHVSYGTHLMGGVFFHTVTTQTQEEVSTSTLMRATAEASKKSKGKSSSSEASASGSYAGVTATVSASMSEATSSGSADFSDSATNGGDSTKKTQAVYTSYVRSLGPNAPTPETFASSLFADNSSWAIIDRGPLSALVPIDHLLRRDDPNDDDRKGEVEDEFDVNQAINWIQVARESRARDWSYLVHEPLSVPLPVREMISRNAPRRVNNDLQASVLQLVTLGPQLEVGDIDTVREVTAFAQATATVFAEAAHAQRETAKAEDRDFLTTVSRELAADGGKVVGAVTLLSEEESPLLYKVIRGMSSSPKDWARFEDNMKLGGQELVLEKLLPQAKFRVLTHEKKALKALSEDLRLKDWNPVAAGWTELEEGSELGFGGLEGVTTSRHSGQVVGLDLHDRVETSFTMAVPTFQKGYFTALTRLRLSGLGLTGTLEDSGIFSHLTALIEVDLHRNRLTGDVPSPSKLPSLRKLDLSRNNLDGRIHADVWLVLQRRNGKVDLSYNNLSASPVQKRVVILEHNYKGWAWDENWNVPTNTQLRNVAGNPYFGNLDLQGFLNIKAVGRNVFLDNNGGRGDESGSITLAASDGGSPYHQWYLSPQTPGKFNIRNRKTGFLLDNFSGRKDHKDSIRAREKVAGTSRYHQWQFVYRGGGKHNIKNVATGYLLSNYAGSVRATEGDGSEEKHQWYLNIAGRFPMGLNPFWSSLMAPP